MQVGVFTLLGLGLAIRRHRDVAVLAIPVYAAETLLWPEINERRVVLALPVILGWYVLGLVSAVRWAYARLSVPLDGLVAGPPAPRRALRARAVLRPGFSAAVALVGAAAIGAPLVAQFPRDYLFTLHQTSSHPGGSRYMSILAAVGEPSTVIETDYESTTALYTGHRTANSAFIAVTAQHCVPSAAQAAIAADHAGYLLLGTVNRPAVMDNICLLHEATTQPFAVRLLSSSRDAASVFELIGPGTAHPHLTNLLPGASLSSSGPAVQVPSPSTWRGATPGFSTVITPSDGTGVLTWSWGDRDLASQVSVGEVNLFHGGVLSGVTLQVERPGGSWVDVADAPGLVGDGGTPYLLGELPPGAGVQGMRLVVRATGPVEVTDISALGTSVAGP
jgi:hypothetical protein